MNLTQYIIRRVFYAIPILIGVNLITFLLFFIVNSPDDMARARLGQKFVSPEMIEQWKEEHQYHLPKFYNTEESGVPAFTETLFFQKSIKLFSFEFGMSDGGRDISEDIYTRMWASLALAIPILIIGLVLNISFALMIIFFRQTYLDTTISVICIVMMSISTLFYVIGGQYYVGKLLKYTPISGFDDSLYGAKFIFLPVLVGVISGMGSAIRWYRSVMLEEIHKDYVRTARAKGLSEAAILFKHILRNALIPIVTGVVVIIPSLFMGSLILESFFGVPGLGSYMIDAIQSQDFAIVRSMVFLGSILYIVGLVLTDITYTVVDPRIRLN